MLERPKADRSAIYRRRRAARRIVVSVEVGAELIELLTRARYLSATRECHCRGEIAEALARMLQDAAR